MMPAAHEAGSEQYEIIPYGGQHRNIRDVAADGIARVRVTTADGRKTVIVNSTSGEYRITAEARTGKMLVTPTPPIYNR